MARRRRKSRSSRRSGGKRSGGIMAMLGRIPKLAFSIPGLVLLAVGAIGIFAVGGKLRSKAEGIASKVNPNASKTA